MPSTRMKLRLLSQMECQFYSNWRGDMEIMATSLSIVELSINMYAITELKTIYSGCVGYVHVPLPLPFLWALGNSLHWPRYHESHSECPEPSDKHARWWINNTDRCEGSQYLVPPWNVLSCSQAPAPEQGVEEDEFQVAAINVVTSKWNRFSSASVWLGLCAVDTLWGAAAGPSIGGSAPVPWARGFCWVLRLVVPSSWLSGGICTLLCGLCAILPGVQVRPPEASGGPMPLTA